MITYRTGNLLDDDADALCNANNAVGIQGGGIARQFRDRWPEADAVYRYDCEIGIVKPNEVSVIQIADHPDIITFVTKFRPQDPSRLDYIDKGLEHLVSIAPDYGWKSVAFPKLGAGLGGLDWEDVKPIMLKHLEGAEFEARIYE